MFVGGLGQVVEPQKTVTWACILPKWMYREGAPCRRTEEWGIVTVPASVEEEIDILKSERRRSEVRKAAGDAFNWFGLGPYMKFAFWAVLAAGSIGLYMRLRG